jgi:molybdopterin-guanine dinucleotide biosynthesis protein A
LLTVPVDLRNLPENLSDALCGVLEANSDANGVAVRDVDGLQPLVALWPVSLARLAVGAALDEGRQAVHPLLNSLQFRIHDISPWRLGNLNTSSDFE